MPLPIPPSLSTNWKRLWTFDLDKSQVRGKYNCVRDIRRSHCQPFCACMLLSWSEHMLAPSWSREIALSRFSLLCVCFQHQRVSNSNNLGFRPGYYIPSGKRGPDPDPERCVLLPNCSSPEIWPRAMTFQICEWTWTAEFLDKVGKRSLKTGTAVTTWVLCTNQDKKRHWGDQVMSWWSEYWDCVMCE
jgi:hypothetical protein